MEKLIEMVRKKPYLYDKSNAGYKNTLLKEKTWREIAKILNVDETKCKNKWKGLRDSFYRELKKQTQRSGSSSEILSKWKYFEKMTFLRTVPQLKRTTSNFECVRVGKEEHDSNFDSYLDMSLSDEEDNDLTESNVHITSTPISTSIPNGINDSISVTDASTPIDEEFMQFLKKLLPNNIEKEDNISFFFKNAAGMVRNANFSQIESIELQMEILSIIKKKIQNKK